jgi:hypothetical protein
MDVMLKQINLIHTHTTVFENHVNIRLPSSLLSGTATKSYCRYINTTDVFIAYGKCVYIYITCDNECALHISSICYHKMRVEI